MLLNLRVKGKSQLYCWLFNTAIFNGVGYSLDKAKGSLSKPLSPHYQPNPSIPNKDVNYPLTTRIGLNMTGNALTGRNDTVFDEAYKKAQEKKAKLE